MADEQVKPAPQQFGAVPLGQQEGYVAEAGPSVRPPARPLPRPKDGRLTRKHMEQIIRGGESVMHGHRVIDRLEDLPDDADLAAGDAERSEAVRDSIDAQIAALTAQRARLDRPREQAPAQDAATTDPGAPPPAGDGGEKTTETDKGGKKK